MQKSVLPVERDDFSLCVLAKKCKLFEEFSGEKAHIPKERCDFVE